MLSLSPLFSGLTIFGHWLWQFAIDVFQITIEIAAGGHQQTRVLLERLFICLQGLIKRVKLRVLAIRFGVDAGRFGVRLADGLLGLTVRLRADAVQLATNPGAGAVPRCSSGAPTSSRGSAGSSRANVRTAWINRLVCEPEGVAVGHNVAHGR